MLSQSGCQSVSLTVLVQLNSYAAHSGSRDSLGMRSLGDRPLLSLDFGGYLLGIGQSVGNRSIDFGKRHTFEFFEDIFRLASMEEPTVNRTDRNPLSGEARAASTCAWSFYDEAGRFP